MVRRRLVPELHGSGGYTTLGRVVAACGLMVAVLVSAHLLGTSWYMGRMLPGTVIGDRNVGGMTVPQARQVVTNSVQAAQIKLVINGQQFLFTPQDLGVTYQISDTLQTSYNATHAAWSLGPVSQQQPLVYHVDSSTLSSVIGAVASKIGIAPIDASVLVFGNQVTTVPDKNGYTVDRIGLARLIEKSLGTGTSVALSASPRAQPATIMASHLSSAIDATRQLMTAQISLTYGTRVWSPSAAVIGSWLAFQRADTGDGTATLKPVVDIAKVKSYVQTIANQADVAAVNQLVTTQNGVDTINQVGLNGTAIDQDSAVAAVAAAVTARQTLAFAVTDHVVAFKTINTSFTVLNYPKYIEVNLNKQHAWVWQDGQIIYDTPITSGATGAGFPTVTGLFAIYYKTTNTHLIGNQYGPRYNYDVAVKYWMPFYDGYGLHDASWRNGNFGGQDYWRGGSHGCVNLPDAAAAFIYNWSDVGTPVWVHN